MKIKFFAQNLDSDDAVEVGVELEVDVDAAL